MDKLVELNREYWGRVHDMCDGTDVKPWECVRYFNKNFVSFSRHPIFEELINHLREWHFAVAILKDDHTGLDRPVFVGDTLYDKTRHQFSFKVKGSLGINGFLCERQPTGPLNIQLDSEDATWRLPKPKRTFTLNGVELPCPDKGVTGNYVALIYFQNGKARASNDFFFGSEEDCFDFCDKLNQIFESAYPKRGV